MKFFKNWSKEERTLFNKALVSFVLTSIVFIFLGKTISEFVSNLDSIGSPAAEIIVFTAIMIGIMVLRDIIDDEKGRPVFFKRR